MGAMSKARELRLEKETAVLRALEDAKFDGEPVALNFEAVACLLDPKRAESRLYGGLPGGDEVRALTRLVRKEKVGSERLGGEMFYMARSAKDAYSEVLRAELQSLWPDVEVRREGFSFGEYEFSLGPQGAACPVLWRRILMAGVELRSGKWTIVPLNCIFENRRIRWYASSPIHHGRHVCRPACAGPNFDPKDALRALFEKERRDVEEIGRSVAALAPFVKDAA